MICPWRLFFKQFSTLLGKAGMCLNILNFTSWHPGFVCQVALSGGISCPSALPPAMKTCAEESVSYKFLYHMGKVQIKTLHSIDSYMK